ncbi:S41 family peptidase [Neobacillus sp. D3-1R]|uniref:S41 family peptidase n=1 Tax=Neobacillus sp. D3-1R TaxID=3445778 RepID=UPI003FA117A3
MIAQNQLVTKEIQKEIIHKIVEHMNSDYIFPEKAIEVSDLLINKLQKGEYDRLEDSTDFAAALTKDLQSVTLDKHIRVRFNPELTSAEAEKSEEEYFAEYQRKAKTNNYGFHKVERLSGNIGYIDLRGFEDPQVGGETAINAMNFITNTEALIFDLRKNGGGSPGMIALISSYLFDDETHLNNFYYRPDDSFHQSWTLPYVPGKKYGNKPVYVLTSNYTFSAAEEFTYNLKNLKRATIVGEVTGGGAHPGGVRQLSNHYHVFIPTGRAINPITNTNWEGTGVEPNVKLTGEEAFDYAYREALQHVKEKYQDQFGYKFLVDEVDSALNS